MNIIAKIHTEFPDKFGVPRQSGIVEGLRGKIIFEPRYRNPDALRGLDGFSHIWLLWEFSRDFSHEGVTDGEWSPTVRPPKLGGNRRMGVFATRSPNRPNRIGLSSVKLESIYEDGANGTVLIVSGADLVDGTPIYDIKPYIPYADCHPDATSGFVPDKRKLSVIIPDDLASLFPGERLATLRDVLAQDPRPSYQNDPKRIYGFGFAGFNIEFTVNGEVLTVCSVIRKD